MAEQYSAVYMYIFSIHSSVDGHLDCLHDLAIVNSAAMNTGVHVSFWILGFFSEQTNTYTGNNVSQAPEAC